MGQSTAPNGLTAEAEAAVIDAVAELRERLQRYDRRGMFGEINIAIIVADGKFDTRCGDYRRKKIKLSA